MNQGPVVLPSRDDDVVAAGSGGIGGPAGTRVATGGGWWTALRIVLAMTVVVVGLGLVLKEPCRSDGWSEGDQYVHACYSDIGFLFRDRGLSDGISPYASPVEDERLEYPVLTGTYMWIVAQLVGDDGEMNDRMRRFYDYTALGLLVAAVVAAWAVARTHPRRPWDAAMFALAPGLLLAATINWDLLAVALTSVALLAWARSRPMLAGLLLGLAVAAKFYPLFILGPLFLLCLRAGRMRDFARMAGTAVVTWVGVNLPVYLAWPEGWKRFYTFSSDRSWDYGSFWYALDLAGHPVSRDGLNTIAALTFGVMCLGIAYLALGARLRPRLPQLAFLVVAAFLVTNKVYSPQFVLWLIPLAVLARPRWRDFLIWQVCEVVYFFAAWWFLQSLNEPERALSASWYGVAVMVHVLGTAYFAAMVVRDVLRPENDPIRAERLPPGSPPIDDPAGGVLDGAPDQVTLARLLGPFRGGSRRPSGEGTRPDVDDAQAPAEPSIR
jgi:uncharacterized membrane protein